MKTESLKLEIIEWVTKLGNKDTLSSLIKFKKAAEDGDWFEYLTEKQKRT